MSDHNEVKIDGKGGPQRQSGQPVSVAPFIVECGDDGNRQIPLDMMRLWLRGRWLQSNVKCDMGAEMRKMLDSPGMRLEVRPRDLTLRIFDPLSLPENAGLLANLKKAVEQITSIKSGSGRQMAAHPTVVHKLSQDEMKTLLMEIAQKVHGPQPCMFVVEGSVPTRAQLESFPGRELNDPWNSNPHKPPFKDQVEAFRNRFDRMLDFGEAIGSAVAQ